MCKYIFSLITWIRSGVCGMAGGISNLRGLSSDSSSHDDDDFSEPLNRPPEENEDDHHDKEKRRSQKLDFNNMPLDEKRSYYQCRDRYVTLEDIPRWPDYVKDNKYLFVKEGLLKSNSLISPKIDKLSSKVSLWKGDITCLEIDAIVNAANESLRGGGGVDGCIHRAAGRGLLNECITLNGCKTGHAKITSGYKLPAKRVIHTVGPIGEKKNKLQQCYNSCLSIVKEHRLRTLAFCCISTGIYGYPGEKAAGVAVGTVRRWLQENEDAVERIIFCVFSPEDRHIYSRLMLEYFPCTTTEGDDGNKTTMAAAVNDSQSDSVEDETTHIPEGENTAKAYVEAPREGKESADEDSVQTSSDAVESATQGDQFEGQKSAKEERLGIASDVGGSSSTYKDTEADMDDVGLVEDSPEFPEEGAMKGTWDSTAQDDQGTSRETSCDDIPGSSRESGREKAVENTRDLAADEDKTSEATGAFVGSGGLGYEGEAGNGEKDEKGESLSMSVDDPVEGNADGNKMKRRRMDDDEGDEEAEEMDVDESDADEVETRKDAEMETKDEINEPVNEEK